MNVYPMCKINGLTIEVAPVVHAHWIDNCDERTGDSRYTCSRCGIDWTFIEGTPGDNSFLYCPNCGAHMDEQEKK